MIITNKNGEKQQQKGKEGEEEAKAKRQTSQKALQSLWERKRFKLASTLEIPAPR